MLYEGESTRCFPATAGADALVNGGQARSS